MGKYPELEKMEAIPESERNLIADFYDNISTEFSLCRLDDYGRFAGHANKDEVIAKYWNIDLEEFNKQKEAAIQEALKGQQKINDRMEAEKEGVTK